MRDQILLLNLWNRKYNSLFPDLAVSEEFNLTTFKVTIKVGNRLLKKLSQNLFIGSRFGMYSDAPHLPATELKASSPKDDFYWYYNLQTKSLLIDNAYYKRKRLLYIRSPFLWIKIL